MDNTIIIAELDRNSAVFEALLSGIPQSMYTWRPAPGKWCLLEVVSHLYDEEREDFRARVQHILENPGQPMPPIDPQGWVTGRSYMENAYDAMVASFLAERQISVNWLRSLQKGPWTNVYHHPKIGAMSAEMILANWLAHDYLHIRQITGIKFRYLEYTSAQDLSYAGNW